MNKVIRDGKVGVLISPGYGAGFYTWGAPEEAVFDPILIELIEECKIQQAIDYVTTTYPDVYTGGVQQLVIEWIPQGSKFIIDEYDGSESIQLLEETLWITA